MFSRLVHPNPNPRKKVLRVLSIFRHVAWGKRTEKMWETYGFPRIFLVPLLFSGPQLMGKSWENGPPGMAMLVCEATS